MWAVLVEDKSGVWQVYAKDIESKQMAEYVCARSYYDVLRIVKMPLRVGPNGWEGKS